MRRLTQHDRDDHGVGTIFIILAMVFLLVSAALAIDVGRFVVEARSAQNSADATALAMATDCARTKPRTDYSSYSKTDQSVAPTVPGCTGTSVTVTVATPMIDGLLVDHERKEVQRDATAQWEGSLLTEATTVPITISNCEFVQALLDGTSDIVIYLDDPTKGTGCSSLPGGFSQLADPDDNCMVDVSTEDGTFPGKPGGDEHKQIPCLTNPTPPALPHEVLIPMYDAAACQAAGCKGHGPYKILGFAMFRVTGYSFNGANYEGLGKKCPDESRGKYCIRGDFIRFVTSQGTPCPTTGCPTENYGATLVRLTD